MASTGSQGSCLEFYHCNFFWLKPTPQSKRYELKPSANSGRPGVDEWLGASRPAVKILNDIFALVHPALHDSGKKALGRLGEDELTEESSRKWTSVFTGISVIANRRPPSHATPLGPQVGL